MINLSDRVNVNACNPDFKYAKRADGTPWESVSEFKSAMATEVIDIPLRTTILVNINGVPTEMWNRYNINEFVDKVPSEASTNKQSTGYAPGFVVVNPNLPLSLQIINSDTIYEIRDDFNLNGELLDMPERCTLRFNGGCIRNGSIYLRYAKIERIGTYYPILPDISFHSRAGSDLYLSYFNWDSTYSLANFNKLSNLYYTICTTKYNVVYDIPELYIEYNATIHLEAEKVYDFNNVTIYAHSLTLSRYLFTLEVYDFKTEQNRTIETEYKKISEAVQDGFFQYKQGIMFITDNTPLYNRVTTKVDYERRDVLLVQNNELCNIPIMDYDNDPDTDAVIKFMPITKGFKFCNLRYDRSGSENMAPLIWINYVYKPEICNIIIDSTHQWKGYCESGTIRLEYVYAPYLHDLALNNCYGDVVGTDQVNYNINMQGATNVIIERVFANSKWHTFGNQSINGVVCRDCVLDQWDSHVYGRDFLFENCTFHLDHLGCPEVGFLKCIHCKFIDSNVGYLSDSDVSVFPTKRIFEGCTFESQDKPLVRVSPMHEHDEVRALVFSERYPSLTLKDCIINVSAKRTTYVLYEVAEGYNDSTTGEFIRSNGNLIDGEEMADINIENLTFNYKGNETLRIWLTNNQNFKVNIKIDGLKSIKDGSLVFLSTETIRRGFLQMTRNQIDTRYSSTTLVQNTNDFFDTFSNSIMSGTTLERPNVRIIGTQYFDTTLGKPIYWNGTSWVDNNGTIV